MPTLQFVKTSDDPSVPEALHSIAEVLKNATTLALRNQLAQIELQHQTLATQTAVLRNKQLEQALSQQGQRFPLEMQQIQQGLEQSQARFPLEQQHLGGQVQQQQIQNQYAGPLAQQQVEGGAIRNQISQQNLAQEKFTTTKQPEVYEQERKAKNQKFDLGTAELNVANHASTSSGMKLIEQTEEFNNRFQTREFRSALGEAIKSMAPEGADAGYLKNLDFHSLLLSDQMIGSVAGIVSKMNHDQEERTRTKAQLEHYKAIESSATQSTKKAAIIELMRHPQSKAVIGALYPNDPEIQSAVQHAELGPEDIIADPNSTHDEKLGAALRMHELAHAGQLPKVTKTDPNNPLGQVQEVDYGIIEKELTAFEALARRRKQGGTAQPATQAAPKGEPGTSEENPIILKQGEDWRKYPPGTVVKLPNGKVVRVPRT